MSKRGMGDSQPREKKKGEIAQLLEFADDRKWLTIAGCALTALAMVADMVPYVCIWLVVRDLVMVAPNWSQAGDVAMYGWVALAFALIGIVLYFTGLLLTHLAAFRLASNIQKRGAEHMMRVPLGYFDDHASGLIRRRIDGAAAETHSLVAHNLADIAGTVVMFVGVVVILFVFDWRMGLACFAAAVISVVAMCSMMAGKNANLMTEYQTALDKMSKAGTEYVRGIPVVKVFQQTIYSFKAFKSAIDEYSEKGAYYEGHVCKVPQSINLTVLEGVFALMVPVALLLAPAALEGDFAQFIVDLAFYAIFSAIVSTALSRVMFASAGFMMASDSLSRINSVLDAPLLSVAENPQNPRDASVEFQDVTFTYAGADVPAVKGVSFRVEAGSTVALVGPSGGGKTTVASLVPRFWDAQEGRVLVGGVDVREADPHALMDHIAFVFQNSRLFKMSIMENVRMSRPEASDEEVMAALSAAQCDDILAKMPDGAQTLVGSKGVYLSGGEQQRVALARAILKDAPIVVLDEATAFADAENEALIQKALGTLMHGRTVIMIAHRLSTVIHADSIVVLNRGEIVESGTHDQLVDAGGLYARMWSDYQQAVQWKIGGEVA